MNGINIKKPEKDYYTCDVCEVKENVLEIEADVSCHEYGSCCSTIWLCIDCLTKISNGEFEISRDKVYKP